MEAFLFGPVMAKNQQCYIEDNHKYNDMIKQGHSNFFPVLRTPSLFIKQQKEEKPYLFF